MNRFVFAAPGEPWSTNEDRLLNRYERNRRTQDWRQMAKLAARQARVPVLREVGDPRPPVVVQITIPFRTVRKRDPHNYCGTVLKAVIDGLVDARVVPDDSGLYIGHRESLLVVAKHGTVAVELHT